MKRFAALLLAIPLTANAQIVDSVARRLLTQRVDSAKNPGIVLGILENGRQRIIAVGKSDAPSGTLDGNTLFEIGSLTKLFTSTVLADMVRRHEVSLDDPVAKFLPEHVKMPQRGGRQITFVDLSTQFSGLPAKPDNMHPKDAANPFADYTREQLYEFLSGYKLARDIGSKFEYSNLGVGLLGEALAEGMAIPYEQLVSQRVLAPLGMSDTRITLAASQQQRFAQPHAADGSPAPHWELPSLAGAAALRSTANDMLKFARAAISEAGPLGNAFKDAQKPRRFVLPDSSVEIGLNWFTLHAGPTNILWHNGGTAGYRSYIGIDKQNHRAVILLTNSGNPVDDIGRKLLIDAAGTAAGK
jgi:CubicO group peptidase (beta-lactamase class C family)